jgi:hypothetical protein
VSEQTEAYVITYIEELDDDLPASGFSIRNIQFFLENICIFLVVPGLNPIFDQTEPDEPFV